LLPEFNIVGGEMQIIISPEINVYFTRSGSSFTQSDLDFLEVNVLSWEAEVHFTPSECSFHGNLMLLPPK